MPHIQNLNRENVPENRNHVLAPDQDQDRDHARDRQEEDEEDPATEIETGIMIGKEEITGEGVDVVDVCSTNMYISSIKTRITNYTHK